LSSASTPPVRIVSDWVAEAQDIESLLRPDFENVSVHIDSGKVPDAFNSQLPTVLVLAFKELQEAERFYLAHYRHGKLDVQQAHRTVLLCGKQDVIRAYELCRRGVFDDYVQFWPLTYDPKRLSIAVHRALKELSSALSDTPSLSAFAAQARRLAELEDLLTAQLRRGQAQIESAGRATPEVWQAWTGDVMQVVAPYLESARVLAQMASRVRGAILVVEDNALQRKLLETILAAEDYEARFAADGAEAWRALGRTAPDLILLDLNLPDMSGWDLVKQLKSTARLSGIPVILMTGNGERSAVLRSRELGVADFVVKPFDRAALLGKLAAALNHDVKAPIPSVQGQNS
jgi:CheY-like chemotaxis protein